MLGKVFISHSSADKPFVRSLVEKIESAGFRTWLDEKQLKVGDSLPRKISEAVKSAPAVLVVVSEASIQSRWLSYELNIATQAMVDGKCRVIPVVIDDSELPAEVEGILYADFREESDSGLKQIVTALKHQDRNNRINSGFSMRSDLAVKDCFDSTGSVSSLSDGYRNLDYDIAIVNLESDTEENVLLEYVDSYSTTPKALPELWNIEYLQHFEDFTESLALVISKRPYDFTRTIQSESSERVSANEASSFRGRVSSYVVYVDLSGIEDFDSEVEIVEHAKSMLESLATELNNETVPSI